MSNWMGQRGMCNWLVAHTIAETRTTTEIQVILCNMSTPRHPIWATTQLIRPILQVYLVYADSNSKSGTAKSGTRTFEKDCGYKCPCSIWSTDCVRQELKCLTMRVCHPSQPVPVTLVVTVSALQAWHLHNTTGSESHQSGTNFKFQWHPKWPTGQNGKAKTLPHETTLGSTLIGFTKLCVSPLVLVP